jgi:hypothetical protein
MDAEGTAIAEVLRPAGKECCSTFVAASGWVAVRRLVVRADHVAVTGLMQASWTVACDMRLGEIPSCSWWLRP